MVEPGWARAGAAFMPTTNSAQAIANFVTLQVMCFYLVAPAGRPPLFSMPICNMAHLGGLCRSSTSLAGIAAGFGFLVTTMLRHSCGYKLAMTARTRGPSS
jgi:hypothetical protein